MKKIYQISIEELDNIIKITDENGVEIELEFWSMIEYNGQKYAAFLPVEIVGNSDAKIIFYKITDM